MNTYKDTCTYILTYICEHMLCICMVIGQFVILLKGHSLRMHVCSKYMYVSACVCARVCLHVCVCTYTHTYMIYCEVLCTMTYLDAIIVILARPDYCDNYCDTSTDTIIVILAA